MDYETFLDIEPVFTGSELTDFLAGRGVARPVETARRLDGAVASGGTGGSGDGDHLLLWGITASNLDQFRPPRHPGRPYHLDPAPLQRPRFVDAWNLVVPIAVVERQWELVF